MKCEYCDCENWKYHYCIPGIVAMVEEVVNERT